MSGTQERLNATTFNDRGILATYFDGWSDLGERRMMGLVQRRLAGRPVLDLGVGTGRTTALLTRRVSQDYVGLDLAPNCVEICHARLPDVDVRVGDARDLGAFPTGSCGLVTFSYNGIDCIGHNDRQVVLAEMARVVADDGLVWFSTLNLDHFYARARPWLLDAQGHPLRLRPSNVRRFVPWLRTLPQRLPAVIRAYRNWWRIRSAGEEGDDWAVRPLQLYDFRVLAHYTTLVALRRELADHGLALEALIGSSGDEIPLDSDHAGDPYVHVCVRRTAVGRPSQSAAGRPARLASSALRV